MTDTSVPIPRRNPDGPVTPPISRRRIMRTEWRQIAYDALGDDADDEAYAMADRIVDALLDETEQSR